jgi:hypothetical protein
MEQKGRVILTEGGGGDLPMKRWVLVGLVALMILALSSISFAGDRGRGRWEGFAIGLGAVTLYNLFEHGTFSPVIPPHRGHERRVYYPPPVVHEPSGHWEIVQEYIPEERERVWVPGHYEDGYWVKGHHEVRVYPGHYIERKVWVEHEGYNRRPRVKHGPPPWVRDHKYKVKY